MIDGAIVSRNKFRIHTKINDELILVTIKGEIPQFKINIDSDIKTQRD